MHPRSPEVTKRDARPPRGPPEPPRWTRPTAPDAGQDARRPGLSRRVLWARRKQGHSGFHRPERTRAPRASSATPGHVPKRQERVSRDLRDNAQSGRAPTAGRPGARRQGEGEQTVAPSCRGAGLGDKKGQATNAYGISKPKERPLDGETHGDVPLTRTLRPAAGLTGDARPSGGRTAPSSRATALLSVFTGMVPSPCRN